MECQRTKISLRGWTVMPLPLQPPTLPSHPCLPDQMEPSALIHFDPIFEPSREEGKNHAQARQPQPYSSFSLRPGHILHPDPVDTWRGYTCSLVRRPLLKSLGSVVKSCCDSCPSTQREEISQASHSLTMSIWQFAFLSSVSHISITIRALTAVPEGKQTLFHTSVVSLAPAASCLAAPYSCFIAAIHSLPHFHCLCKCSLGILLDEPLKPLQFAITLRSILKFLQNRGILLTAIIATLDHKDY